MTEVRQLFAETQPGPTAEHLGPDFVAMARTVAAICATRILLLIAVLAGCGVWAFTVYDPTQGRLIAAAGYSILFVLPQVALYLRRG
jgi:hypothetical protein